MWNNMSWQGAPSQESQISMLQQQAQQYATVAALTGAPQPPPPQQQWGTQDAWMQWNQAQMYGGYMTPGMAPALPGAAPGALYPPHIPPQQPGAAVGGVPLPSAASGAVLPASSTAGVAPPQPPLPQARTDDPASEVAGDLPMPELDEDNDPDLKEFDEQFKGWEQQFNQWKKENAEHPDKDALVKYEADWSKWRKELLERRETIKSNKLKELKEKHEKERQEQLAKQKELQQQQQLKQQQEQSLQSTQEQTASPALAPPMYFGATPGMGYGYGSSAPAYPGYGPPNPAAASNAAAQGYTNPIAATGYPGAPPGGFVPPMPSNFSQPPPQMGGAGQKASMPGYGAPPPPSGQGYGAPPSKLPQGYDGDTSYKDPSQGYEKDPNSDQSGREANGAYGSDPTNGQADNNEAPNRKQEYDPATAGYDPSGRGGYSAPTGGRGDFEGAPGQGGYDGSSGGRRDYDGYDSYGRAPKMARFDQDQDGKSYDASPNENKFDGPSGRGGSSRGGGFSGPGRGGGFNGSSDRDMKDPARYGAPDNQSGNDGSSGRGEYDGPSGRGGYDGPSGRGGYDGPPGRGGYEGPPGRGGYDGPSGRGGYDGPSGRGGYDGPSGRGGYDGPSGREGCDGPAGRGGYDGPSGRGGYDGSSGRGGHDGPSGRGGYDGASGRGGYDGASGRGGYDGPPGRGGYDGPPGRGGYDGPSGRGGYDASSSRGGYDGSSSRGGIDGPLSRGGYGGYDGPSGRGGFDGPSGRGGYGPSGRGGFDGPPGRGVLDDPSANDDFSGPSGRGGFGSGRGRGSGWGDDASGQGGFGGPPSGNRGVIGSGPPARPTNKDENNSDDDDYEAFLKAQEEFDRYNLGGSPNAEIEDDPLSVSAMKQKQREAKGGRGRGFGLADSWDDFNIRPGQGPDMTRGRGFGMERGRGSFRGRGGGMEGPSGFDSGPGMGFDRGVDDMGPDGWGRGRGRGMGRGGMGRGLGPDVPDAETDFDERGPSMDSGRGGRGVGAMDRGGRGRGFDMGGRGRGFGGPGGEDMLSPSPIGRGRGGFPVLDEGGVRGGLRGRGFGPDVASRGGRGGYSSPGLMIPPDQDDIQVQDMDLDNKSTEDEDLRFGSGPMSVEGAAGRGRGRGGPFDMERGRGGMFGMDMRARGRGGRGGFGPGAPSLDHPPSRFNDPDDPKFESGMVSGRGGRGGRGGFESPEGLGRGGRGGSGGGRGRGFDPDADGPGFDDPSVDPGRGGSDPSELDHVGGRGRGRGGEFSGRGDRGAYPTGPDFDPQFDDPSSKRGGRGGGRGSGFGDKPSFGGRGRGGFDESGRGGGRGFDPQFGRGRGMMGGPERGGARGCGSGRGGGEEGGKQRGLIDELVDWSDAGRMDAFTGNDPQRGRGPGRGGGASSRGRDTAWWHSNQPGIPATSPFAGGPPKTGGSIPGLDVAPDADVPAKKEGPGGPPDKRPETDRRLSGSSVFHEEKDDKIDVKLDKGRLVMGPIGVTQRGDPSWKPPADWYDDDDDDEERDPKEAKDKKGGRPEEGPESSKPPSRWGPPGGPDGEGKLPPPQRPGAPLLHVPGGRGTPPRRGSPLLPRPGGGRGRGGGLLPPPAMGRRPSPPAGLVQEVLEGRRMPDPEELLRIEAHGLLPPHGRGGLPDPTQSIHEMLGQIDPSYLERSGSERFDDRPRPPPRDIDPFGRGPSQFDRGDPYDRDPYDEPPYGARGRGAPPGRDAFGRPIYDDERLMYRGRGGGGRGGSGRGGPRGGGSFERDFCEGRDGMEGRGGAAVAGGVEDPDMFVGGSRPRPGYDREPLRQDHLKPPRLDDETGRELPPPYFDPRDPLLRDPILGRDPRDPLHDPRDLMRGGPPRDPLHDLMDAFGRERDPLRPPAYDRDQRDPRDPYSETDRPLRRGDPFLDPRDPDDPRVMDYAHRAPSDRDLRDLDSRPSGAEIRDPERDREYPGRYPPPRPEFRDGAEWDRAPKDRRERDRREGERDRRDGDRDRRRDDRGSRRERSPGRDRDRDHRGGRDMREVEEASPPPGQVVAIDDLLAIPGRFLRPPKLAIVLRGLPGSGKSTIAKLIKDREVVNGGSAPRILCLDDYFMVESEKLEVERDTGRKVKTKIMEYEYDEKLEERYRQSLVRSYKKQVDDGFFPFIVLDCINHKIVHFQEIITFSNNNGFEVYVGDVEGGEVPDCHQRSTHKRPLQHVQKLADEWEPTPRHMRRVDLTALAQDAQIPEVEMEDASSSSKGGSTSVSSLAPPEVVPKGLGGVAGLLSAFAERNANSKNDTSPANNKSNGNGSPGTASPAGTKKSGSPIATAIGGGEKAEKDGGKQENNDEKKNKDEKEGISSGPAQESKEEEDEDSIDAYKTFAHLVSSKWDTEETSIEKLDKLDGVKAAKKRIGLQHQQITNKPQSIKDWLELSKDYDVRVSQPGKKRVRWADFEERKKQTSARERGFVLGQTDWQRMTDLSCGSNALVQVRYIEPRENAN